MQHRRDFIKILSYGSGAFIIPNPLKKESNRVSEKIKFAICADIHKDIMHDADARLQAFIDEVANEDLDFIIQMGDFCRPYDYNLDFLSIWNSYAGKKYHVIGNHDMDGGFSRQDVVKYWNSLGQYYSFDHKGCHFIVLDGNDEDPSEARPAGYARFIGEEQLTWLANDLDETHLPCIVFCHQGLDNDLGGIYNGTQSRLVLEGANKKAGFQKVQIVFSGHHHQDYHNIINGIHYVQINSMSYYWLGDKYKHIRYSEEVDKNYPWIKYTVPYKNPIWAYVEIADHQFNLFGKKSEFVGPSPEDLGVIQENHGYPIVPFISNKEFGI